MWHSISRRVVLTVGVVLLAGACEPRGKQGGPQLDSALSPPSQAQPSPSASHAEASVSSSAIVASSAAASATATAKAVPPLRSGGAKAVRSAFGMVSSEDPHATRIGVAILEKGGTAVDAAVAVGYALSVTHHAAGSLGGGGFMIVHLASGETHAIDYREMAPAAATVALNEKQLAAGAHGYLSAAVPGVVAGLNLARARFGTKPLAELIQPSLKLAREGHAYGARQAQVLGWFWKRLKRDPGARALFGRAGRPVRRAQRLKQAGLAKTLQAIAERGDDGFYRGPVAEKIAAAMKRHGGLVTQKDLAAYRAKIRVPLKLRYRGFDVATMPPPSMGGIALFSILSYLKQYEPAPSPATSALSYHYYIEAARRAYADRRAIGADPDAIDPALVGPLRERLLGRRYYRERLPAISATRATPSKAITPIHATPAGAPESPDTTHFSVVDRHGNAVACTTTLSAAFGARIVVPGTGVLFSNAMGAFSPEGVNVLKPGKRMASSMTPTLLLQQGKVVAVLGSPGGDTIPGTVAQVLRHLVDHRMTIDAAIETGRTHHQYLPDVVRSEKQRAMPAATMRQLEAMGHRFKVSPIGLGDANGIVFDWAEQLAWGYADSRKGGLAAGPAAMSSPKP